jgi:hypothetical protein
VRTTLSLDDDVAAALQHRQHALRAAWKEVVNDVLREGLRTLEQRPATESASQPAPTEPVSLGTPLIDVTNVHEALAVVERDHRR